MANPSVIIVNSSTLSTTSSISLGFTATSSMTIFAAFCIAGSPTFTLSPNTGTVTWATSLGPYRSVATSPVFLLWVSGAITGSPTSLTLSAAQNNGSWCTGYISNIPNTTSILRSSSGTAFSGTNIRISTSPAQAITTGDVILSIAHGYTTVSNSISSAYNYSYANYYGGYQGTSGRVFDLEIYGGLAPGESTTTSAINASGTAAATEIVLKGNGSWINSNNAASTSSLLVTQNSSLSSNFVLKGQNSLSDTGVG